MLKELMEIMARELKEIRTTYERVGEQKNEKL